MKVWQSRPQGSYPEKALIPWLLFLLPAPTPPSMWQLPVTYPPLLTGSVKCGEGNGTPLQYSCLENPWTEEPGGLQSMGSRRVGHNWATSLSLFHFHALEKEMATHSSVLAWRIPGTGEPGGLLSMGSQRIEHDWSDLEAAAVWSETVPKRFISRSRCLLMLYLFLQNGRKQEKCSPSGIPINLSLVLENVVQSLNPAWLCDPMNCSLPGFSVYRILQARILEWIAISFSRGSSQPSDWTCVSCIFLLELNQARTLQTNHRIKTTVLEPNMDKNNNLNIWKFAPKFLMRLWISEVNNIIKIGRLKQDFLSLTWAHKEFFPSV